MTTEQEDDLSRLRTPPASVESEQSVLGALLLDNNAWDRVGDLLTETDFFRHDHRLVFGAIGKLVNANKPADVITVMEVLRDAGKLDDAGGIEYLSALSHGVASAANIRRYAEIVREKSLLRKMVAAGDEIITAAYNPQGKNAAELLDHAQELVLQVAEQGQKAGDEWASVGEGIPWFLDNINELIEGKQPDVIPIGISDLDEKLDGGIRPGELFTLGMRSGIGKTAFALSAMVHSASLNQPSALFSMEMPREQCNARIVSIKSRVHLSKLKHPERLRDHDWGKITDASEWLGRAPIYINDRTALNINQIRASARALKRRYGLRSLWLDHLRLTRGTDQKQLMTYQLAEVTSGLKSLAKELHVGIGLLVQINRQVDGKTDPMPQLPDIRDTSSVEDDSDKIVFAHRPFKNDPLLPDDWKYFGELSIAKQRDGVLGRLPAMFIGENTCWTNWPSDTPVPTNKVRSRTKGDDL